MTMKTMMIEKTQTMTSLEIAELTGKQHKHVMEAIRKMEPAWEKVHGSKFRLMRREVAIGNGAVRQVPADHGVGSTDHFLKFLYYT